MALYNFALDKSERVVCIDSIKRSEKKKNQYHCVVCGKEMIACIGDKNIPYFRHAHAEDEVNYEHSNESYLHKLAKKSIKELFDSSDVFNISYAITKSCNCDCKLRNYQCDGIQKSHEMNLRDYYDTCLEEQCIDVDGSQYRADLLLTSSEFPQREPVLLEILVTHECSAQKKNAARIIEIGINSEDDIKRITTASGLQEGENVHFYKFKKKFSEKMTVDIPRFVHFPNGKSNVMYIPCNEAKDSISCETDAEINVIQHKFNCSFKEYVKYRYAFSHASAKCLNCANRETRGVPPEYGFFFCKRWRRTINEEQVEDLLNETCYVPKERGLDIVRMERDCSFDFVKGRHHDYNVVVLGNRKFNNPEFLGEKVLHALSNKLKKENVVIHCGKFNSKLGISSCCIEFANKHSIPYHFHIAEWDKYGNRAGPLCVFEMLDIADAVILFINNENETDWIIEEVGKRKLPFRTFDYTKGERTCPLCGANLRMVSGRHGYFFGCWNYPDCKFTRPLTKAEREIS